MREHLQLLILLLIGRYALHPALGRRHTGRRTALVQRRAGRPTQSDGSPPAVVDLIYQASSIFSLAERLDSPSGSALRASSRRSCISL